MRRELDRPWPFHRLWCAPASVGELLRGDLNRWDMVFRPSGSSSILVHGDMERQCFAELLSELASSSYLFTGFEFSFQTTPLHSHKHASYKTSLVGIVLVVAYRLVSTRYFQLSTWPH